MSDQKQSSEELYKLAYNTHYGRQKYDVAYALYNRVIETFPDSIEAQYANTQIGNIKFQYPDIIPVFDEASSVFNAAVNCGLESIPEKQDDFQSETGIDHGSDIWISGMKIFAWITCAGTFISGIAVAFMVGPDNGIAGFLIFIGSIIAAFLSVAMLMIFLNLAQDVSKFTKDISEIKQLLRKIQSDQKQS